MQKRLFFLTLCLAAVSFSNVTAQDRASFTSLHFADKKPPLDWLDNPQRREISAALLRLAPQVQARTGSPNRDAALRALGLSLARLGYENEANRLLISPDDKREARYLLAVRKTLAGRLEDTISLLPSLDGGAQHRLRLVLADAFWLFREDKKSAREWLFRAAIPNAKSDDAIFIGHYFDLQRAWRLAKLDDRAAAKRIFARVEDDFKTRRKDDNSYSQLNLFDARVQSGFMDDALGMLRQFPSLKAPAITTLVQIRKFDEATELLKTLKPADAYENLISMGFVDEVDPRIREFIAENLLRVWRKMSVEELAVPDRTDSLVRSLAILKGVATSFDFIASELKGKTAQDATSQLRATILQDPRLAKQVAPATLQKWRIAELLDAQNRAWQAEAESKIGRGYDEPEHLEAPWQLVAYPAISAKKFEAARFALSRAEKFSKDNPNPAEGIVSRMRLWREIGDEAEAKKLEARFRRLTNQPPAGPLVFEGYFQQDVAAIGGGEMQGQNFASILRISNPTQRSISLADFALAQFPLERVDLSSLP